MSPRRPAAGGQDGSGYASSEALAGLAREVEGVRRQLDTVADVPARVDALTDAVAQLSDAVAAIAAVPGRPGPTPAPSWLAAPHDADALGPVLAQLCEWLRGVFLRYPDGATVLPECWLWHPDVVEELLWLMHAWLAAYQGKGASVQAAGDWHDRQRPGVVRRLRATVGSCSVEKHQARPGRQAPASTAPAVPGVDACSSIARWWATARDAPAPEPAPRDHRDAGRLGLRDVLDAPASPRRGSPHGGHR